MTTAFPQTMDFTGYNVPSRVEADIYDLIVDGKIPDEINGRWYRVTPDPQYPPHLGHDTYLSGDGMASMFLIENGFVDFKSRYVMTERLKNDRKARRSLYGLYRNPFTDHESVQGKPGRSASNTTPVFHAGHLLYTKEDGHPTELDPETLETKGPYNFGGKLRSETMTAHPRMDYDTGELLFYGYEAGGLCTRDVAFCVADKHGTLVREEWFQAPYCGMVHDFAVTKNHVLFPFFPVTADLERLKSGGVHWKWTPELGSHVGIMPRNGSAADMRWFKGPPRSFFHFMNAFDDGDKVHLDFGVSELPPFPFILEASGVTPPPGPPGPINQLTRWTFDLKGSSDTWTEKQLGPAGDFPIVAMKDHMKRYEIGYYQLYLPQGGPPVIAGPVGIGFNAIGRINVNTGELRPYFPGPNRTVQEHIHIPSKQPGHEGYLMFVVDVHDGIHSEVHVLEAEHPEKGPLARIVVPLRLRQQVHGCWVPESALAKA